MHERRTSSQSYNPGFAPQAGRGRGYPQPSYGMSSPGPTFRSMPQQNRNGPAPYAQGTQGPSYNGRGHNSPAQHPAQPHMQQQMQYQGYPQHLGGQYNVSWAKFLRFLQVRTRS